MLMHEFEEHVRGFTKSNISSDKELSLNFALGLIGEIGKTVDLLKKHLYHGEEIDRTSLIKELNNVLWYLVAFAQINKIACPLTDSFIAGFIPRIYGSRATSISNRCIKMSIYAGKVLEATVLEDCETDQETASTSILEVTRQWLAVCILFDIGPSKVIQPLG
jgi:hypothetical protein